MLVTFLFGLARTVFIFGVLWLLLMGLFMGVGVLGIVALLKPAGVEVDVSETAVHTLRWMAPAALMLAGLGTLVVLVPSRRRRRRYGRTPPQFGNPQRVSVKAKQGQ